MNMKILEGIGNVYHAIGFLNIQLTCAASQSVNLNNITDTSQQKLDNVSDTLNQTAQDVQNFIDPIQSILNSINNYTTNSTDIICF